MIPAEQLEKFRPSPTLAEAPRTESVCFSNRGIAKSPDTLIAYLQSHGVNVSGTKALSNGAVALILDGCPMNPGHGHDTSTAVIWRTNGIGFKCQHNSCAEYGWKDVRKKVDSSHRPHNAAEPSSQVSGPANVRADHELPEVTLPGGSVRICDAASELGRLLAPTERFFARGQAVAQLLRDTDDRPILEIVRAAVLPSAFETVARLVRLQASEGGVIVAPATCNEQTAKLIMLSTPFQDSLYSLRLISPCAVLVERGNGLVQITAFDRDSGILAFGKPVPSVPLDNAAALLHNLLVDFRFATESDRSRAVASLITPALAFSGLLPGRPPVDLSEADDSQAGKGYRNKLTAAIYGAKVHAVSQRRGGVGGMEESFDAALIRGANFISLDNVRGKIDSPRIESFLTEDSYMARVPYSGNIEIDTGRVIVMLTSNKAEITPDLANRSSIVRILKQPVGYRFRSYPEGDLLEHVRANQPLYLAAVFAVVRAWHAAGKPVSDLSGHDFRAWARILDWIVQDLLRAAPLLAGHRDAQTRVATPALNWLRDLALAVDRAGRVGIPLRPFEILDLIDGTGVEIPGTDPEADLTDDGIRQKAFRAIGQQLAKCFRKGPVVAIDGYEVRRAEENDHQGRTQRTYAFHAVSRIAPSLPECAPESFSAFPESPECLSNICEKGRMEAGAIEKNGSHSGDSGKPGKRGFELGELPPSMEVMDL